MLYINFKTYQSGTGEQAERMVEVLKQVSLRSGVQIIPVVPSLDLFRVSKDNWDWAWCQHADNIEYGAHSGWLLPEGIKQNGAQGVMLNHAEHKVEHGVLLETVKRCRSVGLAVGICANDLEEVKAVVPMNPDWVAYEPPELIGNIEVSVATAKPEVIQSAVDACGEIPLLIGAGINKEADIRTGLELGAKGFLIASAVMKAENPEEKLEELLSGYQ